jgi:hypothetical protein
MSNGNSYFCILNFKNKRTYVWRYDGNDEQAQRNPKES